MLRKVYLTCLVALAALTIWAAFDVHRRFPYVLIAHAYRSRLGDITGRQGRLNERDRRMIHASVEQKIKALASVLRQEQPA